MTKTFFDLPSEIRNTIYKMAMGTRVIIPQVFVKSFHYPRSRAIKPFKFPALALGVNKQYEKEACFILYGENTFFFDTVYDCFYFLRTIGKCCNPYEPELAGWKYVCHCLQHSFTARVGLTA
jgi:hypothetical protein